MVDCDSRDSCDIPYSPSFPRIGFVFVVNTDDAVDGADDVGVALWRAFNYIAEEQDVSQAFISVVHVSACTRCNFFRMYSRFSCIVPVIVIAYCFYLSKFIKKKCED